MAFQVPTRFDRDQGRITPRNFLAEVVQQGDLIWSRDLFGVYFLGRVIGPWNAPFFCSTQVLVILAVRARADPTLARVATFLSNLRLLLRAHAAPQNGDQPYRR